MSEPIDQNKFRHYKQTDDGLVELSPEELAELEANYIDGSGECISGGEPVVFHWYADDDMSAP